MDARGTGGSRGLVSFLDKARSALDDHLAMFGLGVPELLFIMALALLIFGPKKLPQIGRTLGKGMAEFRRASTELQRSIHLDLDETPRKPTSQPGTASRPPLASSPADEDNADPSPSDG